MNERNNITIKEMISALNQLQSQAEKDFKSYAKDLYSSKVKAHFPHILTPTYQGCFIKISDCYLEDDSNYIDLEQQVSIQLDDQQQTLNSAISARILPFDIINVENQSKGLELIFAAKSEDFSLQDNSFSFWLHSDYIPIEKIIEIFNNLNQINKFYLDIELDDGTITNKTVEVNYGYNYVQHSNHKFRQNLADSRLQFRINVNLHQHFSQKIRSIKLLIKKIYIDELYQDQLNDLFHTNLIPVINQCQSTSDSFIMDGDHEIYWLNLKEEINHAFYIHEVLTVYADNQPLAPIDYKVIYKDGRTGLEFNEISQVFNKTIYADIYISYKLDQALMNSHHKTEISWLNQNISTYKLDIKSLISGSEYKYETQLIKPLLKILKIPYIHQWQILDWQGLLKFTDLSALVDIHTWINDVSVNEQDVNLYFKSVPEEFYDWIRFYLKQLEFFLQKNTKLDFKLKEFFQ
ncbi:type VI secretion system baseplate subunit TssF/IglH [Francisellaceae bacterium CB300]|jgi:hypothetical protein